MQGHHCQLNYYWYFVRKKYDKFCQRQNFCKFRKSCGEKILLKPALGFTFRVSKVPKNLCRWNFKKGNPETVIDTYIFARKECAVGKNSSEIIGGEGIVVIVQTADETNFPFRKEVKEVRVQMSIFPFCLHFFPVNLLIISFLIFSSLEPINSNKFHKYRHFIQFSFSIKSKQLFCFVSIVY